MFSKMQTTTGYDALLGIPHSRPKRLPRPKRPPVASDVQHLVVPPDALQALREVEPVGLGLGRAVAARARDRTAMMDWNCILAKVGSLKN